MSLFGKWFGFGREEVLEEGLAAYDRADYEEAIEAFETCLDSEPDPTNARLARFHLGESYAQLARVRFQRADYEGAERALQSALAIAPNYPDLHLQAARVYRQLGDPGEVRKHVARALGVNSRSVDAMVFDAACRYEGGDWEAGLTRAGEACALDASLDGSALAQARRSHEQGDYDQAAGSLFGLSSGLDAALYHRRAGDRFTEAGSHDEAIREYRAATELAPDHADFHLRLGTILLETGDVQQAVASIQSALEINPRHPEALLRLGVALKRLRRVSEARQAFRRVLEIDPTYPSAAQEFAKAG